jgi:hypothetical protein
VTEWQPCEGGGQVAPAGAVRRLRAPWQAARPLDPLLDLLFGVGCFCSASYPRAEALLRWLGQLCAWLQVSGRERPTRLDRLCTVSYCQRGLAVTAEATPWQRPGPRRPGAWPGALTPHSPASVHTRTRVRTHTHHNLHAHACTHALARIVASTACKIMTSLQKKGQRFATHEGGRQRGCKPCT